MYCPQCGAPVQAYDRFCIRCGHDMQPDGAPERQGATPAYNAAPRAEAQATGRLPQVENSVQQAPYGDWNPGRGQNTLNNGTNWTSGSSTPAPNPYGGAPTPFGNGAPYGGRPRRSGGNNGPLQSVGAAIVALFVILAKFGAGLGAALGSIGLFKLWIFSWLFRALFGVHFAPLFLIIVVLLILGSIAHSRGMV